MNSLPEMAESDFFVLRFVCERFIENEGTLTITSQEVFQATTQHGFPRDEAEDSLILLGKENFLFAHYYADRKRYPHSAHPTFAGFEMFYRKTLREYGEVIQQVGEALGRTNDASQERELETLAQKIGRPKMLVDHILETLENQGHIHVHRSDGGYAHVGQISPSLKRSFPPTR